MTLPNGQITTSLTSFYRTRTFVTETAVPTRAEVADSKSGPSKPIIGGVIGAAVAIILILIVFFVLRHRRRSQRGILLASSEPNEATPGSRNVLSVFMNRRSVPPAMSEADPFRSVVHQPPSAPVEVGGIYGTAVLNPVKKKPVPVSNEGLLGSRSDLASSAPITSAGALQSRWSTPSDNPYGDYLVDISTSPASHAPGGAPASNRSLENIPNPFADPDDPFADPRNRQRLSVHSGNSDLSYASLHSSQSDERMGDADVTRHVSMKSGLSYASLTPSQIQRRMDYVPAPAPALSDASSERRVSEQSAMTMTIA